MSKKKLRSYFLAEAGVFIIITIMLFFSGKICFRNTEKYAFGLVEWFL
jgi:hypothetical protein